MGADAIGICPVGIAVPPAASTLTATAAVMTVLLLAIVIAHSFPQGVSSIGWLANRETSLSNIFSTFWRTRIAF
jgi:hypothetical protein